MREPIESVDYKGLKINIYQDDSSRSPDDDGNDDLFLVAFHRDFSVERKGFELDVCQYLGGDKDKDINTICDAKLIAKKYHVFGLEAYIHSGVVLALSQEGGFPDRQWDVSQLGLVFVEKQTWKTKAKAKKAALALISEWNSYLSGDVYGYVITKDIVCKTCKHVEQEHIDSCWGFVGDKDGCLEEAEAAADNHLKPEVPENQLALI